MLFLLPIAFISGILTVFSPCVLPILPIILASGIDGNTRRIRGVISGLVVSFTVASLLLATLVRALGIGADTVRLLAVGILVIFGLSLVFPKLWEKAQAWIEKHWPHFVPPYGGTSRGKHSGFGGGFITGVSLGVIWTPCIGPVVAAVATLAAVSSFSVSVVFIALAYALGTAVPLYYIAKGGKSVSQKLSVVKRENQKIRRIFGIVVLATALFIWSGADRVLQAWTLTTLPESWTQLATTFETRFNIDAELDKLKGNQSMKKAQPGEAVVKEVNLQSDFSGAKVAKGDLLQGCFGKDCIASIDNPQFETAQEADAWLNPDDRVFALEYEGVIRVYPQRIMNWHEIVNDNIGGTPISITFCPLCGSALAFERTVDGVITEFGVSRNTGFSRNYDHYPYGTYEQDDQLLFGVKGLDNSLQIKTVVYGVETDRASKAYPERVFDERTIIDDTVGGVAIRLEKRANGEIEVTNLDSGESIIPVRLFWFAWAAFHPDTALYVE